MKKVEQYRCDLCGTLYAEKAKCEACEKQHVPCVGIAAQRHRPVQAAGKYPPKIIVTMADGTTQVYERKRSE